VRRANFSGDFSNPGKQASGDRIQPTPVFVSLQIRMCNLWQQLIAPLRKQDADNFHEMVSTPNISPR
jgi:hypothetical protein